MSKLEWHFHHISLIHMEWMSKQPLKLFHRASLSRIACFPELLYLPLCASAVTDIQAFVSKMWAILLVLTGTRIKQTHVALRQPVICFSSEAVGELFRGDGENEAGQTRNVVCFLFFSVESLQCSRHQFCRRMHYFAYKSHIIRMHRMHR